MPPGKRKYIEKKLGGISIFSEQDVDIMHQTNVNYVERPVNVTHKFQIGTHTFRVRGKGKEIEKIFSSNAGFSAEQIKKFIQKYGEMDIFTKEPIDYAIYTISEDDEVFRLGRVEKPKGASRPVLVTETKPVKVKID